MFTWNGIKSGLSTKRFEKVVSINLIISQQCRKILLTPPSKLSCFSSYRLSIPLLQDIQLFWRARLYPSLFLKRKKKWTSVRCIPRFVCSHLSLPFTTLYINVERCIYASNFTSTYGIFFTLPNRAFELVWTSVRLWPDFIGFSNMLHFDLASVVDHTAIFMWSNWVRLGFSAHFSVSFFECTFLWLSLCDFSAVLVQFRRDFHATSA